ncbi:hypothetical protein BMS3Abin07_00053 [bacterium BMS3Abin07]|nr:hypothetical protein BMS3Abin07_00053 [bacterium BMS3Abin07]HDY72520.1 hypothetical protein [Nitrospirota bacterium]
MEKDIRKVWRALRGIVKDGCTFAEIKELVGAGGLPVEELSHLQQRSLPAKGASKSELLDAVDDLIKKEDEPAEAIQHFLGDFLHRKRHLHEKVAECVQRFGWHLAEGVLQPDDLQVEGATRDLSTDIRELLRTAYRRYAQSDYSGAMTSICSAVDSLTTEVYQQHDLGSPHDDSYQKRANRSFLALESQIKANLSAGHLAADEIERVWKNYKGSLNQAAYVLGSFRRNSSDVHGVTECPPELVRHAIDCGTFIVRSTTAGMDGDAQLGSRGFFSPSPHSTVQGASQRLPGPVCRE